MGTMDLEDQATSMNGSFLNLLTPEPVFQVSGSKMTFPEQITITSIFFLKAMINL